MVLQLTDQLLRAFPVGNPRLKRPTPVRKIYDYVLHAHDVAVAHPGDLGIGPALKPKDPPFECVGMECQFRRPEVEGPYQPRQPPDCDLTGNQGHMYAAIFLLRCHFAPRPGSHQDDCANERQDA